jgi:NAD(P)-dependent dehydrogenase (short-subunit alcohol dehydrogenase family)
MNDVSEAAAPPVAEPPRGRFSGKVALVTGASDRGIGGAIAERLASEGAAVALFSREVPRRLVDRLSAAGARVAACDGDVTCGDDVRRAIAACVAELGPIDVLVNNAGVEIARLLDEQPDDEWRRMVEVNLMGAIAVSRAAIPHLRSPGGTIVSVASVLALAGCAGYSVYSATKAALVGFTQSLAWELAPRGMRVVAVAPGLVYTPMTHKYLEIITAEAWEQIKAVHPLGTGNVQDVAAAVAFLASSEARWITGVTLPLGWTSSYPLPQETFLERAPLAAPLPAAESAAEAPFAAPSPAAT